jgi:hypothetical protein
MKRWSVLVGRSVCAIHAEAPSLIDDRLAATAEPNVRLATAARLPLGSEFSDVADMASVLSC